MSRKGLIPKKITDKNGKETTVYVKTNEAASDGFDINKALNPTEDLSAHDDADWDEEYEREIREEAAFEELAAGEGYRMMKSEVTDRFLAENPKLKKFVDDSSFDDFWEKYDSEGLRLSYYDANGSYEIGWVDDDAEENEYGEFDVNLEPDNLKRWLDDDKRFMSEFNEGYKNHLAQSRSDYWDRMLSRYGKADEGLEMIDDLHTLGQEPTMEQRVHLLGLEGVTKEHTEKFTSTRDNRWLLERGSTEYYEKACELLEKEGVNPNLTLSGVMLKTSKSLDAFDEKIQNDPDLSDEVRNMSFPGKVPDKMVEHFTDGGKVNSSDLTQYIMNRMPKEKTDGVNLYIHDVNYSPSTQSLTLRKNRD